jgi:hypothetical protein
MGIKDRAVRTVLPQPVEARHAEYSMLFSADDDVAPPTPRLLDIALAAVAAARTVELTTASARIKDGIRFTEVWPGEHYKLLAGLMKVLEPKVVIEIGTATGLSAVVMKQFMPLGSTLATFDLLAWRGFPGGVLTEEDFKDGTLVQHLDDLSYPEGINKHRALLERADFLFIDAAKDGEQEQRFLDQLATVKFAKPPIVMFDDVRVWNMLRIWRQLRRPKLDLTSFGHWSGTGLVDWSGP